jgi:phosphoribosylanthranilate isomerase
MIKVCGLREPVHAVAAVEAGADLIGFVFAPGRRRVTAGEAALAIAAARGAVRSRRVLAVGVFVDAPAEEMNRAADEADLDLFQLHGDEEPALLARLNRPAIKALRPRPGDAAASVAARVARFATAPRPPAAYLIDGWDPAAHGGTGVRADWALVGAVAAQAPVILAGGLTPENVASAIATAAPLGVDVSSGVETGGNKDPERIAAWVANARRAFGALPRGSVAGSR